MLSSILMSWFVFCDNSSESWDDLLFAGIFVPSVDRFKEENENAVPAAERSNLRPLLDDNEEARTSN
jgi:hypothetical protein